MRTRVVKIFISTCIIFSISTAGFRFQFTNNGKGGFVVDNEKSDNNPAKKLLCGNYHCRASAVTSIVSDDIPVKEASRFSRILSGPRRLVRALKRAFKGLVFHVFVSPIDKLRRSLDASKSTEHEITVKMTFAEPSEIFNWMSLPPIPVLMPFQTLAIISKIDDDKKEEVKKQSETLDAVLKRVFNSCQDRLQSTAAFSYDYLKATFFVGEIVFDLYFLGVLLSILFFFLSGTYLSLPVFRFIFIRCDGHSKPVVIKESELIDLSELAISVLDTQQTAEKKEQLRGVFDGREEAKEAYEENDEEGYLNSSSTSMPASTESSDLSVRESGASELRLQEPKVGATTDMGVERLASTNTMSSTTLNGSPAKDTQVVPPKESAINQGTDDSNVGSFVELTTLFETATTSIDSLSSTQVSPSFTPAKPVTTKAFHCVNPFDQNGVIVYLSSSSITKGKNVVRAKMSTIFMGSEETVIAHSAHDLGLHSFPNYTRNEINSWCAIDLGSGRRLKPMQYSIRHGASSAGNALRNWELRAREKDTDKWITLMVHLNDDKLSDIPLSIALWDIESEPSKVANNGFSIGETSKVDSIPRSERGYRYFLLLQTDVNSSGNNCLFIGGWELYGILTEKKSV